jgi:hypothetical protein
MANAKYDGKYLRCDIVAVKDAEVGGRLHSAEIAEEVPNGVIGTLGATKADKPEVKGLTLGVSNVDDMVIVMRPEINPDESLKSNGALGLHRNEANRPVPVIKLGHRDRIALSQDYFKAGVPSVGAELKVDTDGLIATGAGDGYRLVVVEVKNDKIPALLYAEEGAKRTPIYKMITLEVIMGYAEE